MAKAIPARAVYAGGCLVEVRVGGTLLSLVQGDITRQRVDAIVNAANSGLVGGGGVDGAIHRAGGPEILAECRRIVEERGPLPPGQAVSTTAGDLPARRVIHTVGPVWRGGHGGEAAVLASAYRESLALAEREGMESVAFPSISTGAYGYPLTAASAVALGAVLSYLGGGSRLREVRFVLYRAEAYAAYTRVLEARPVRSAERLERGGV